MLRIATWNIRAGGGSGSRRKSVLAVLEALDADVLVITEYQLSRSGSDLAVAVADLGWETTFTKVQVARERSVLVASRVELELIGAVGHELAPHRWLHARLPRHDLDLLGVYFHTVLPKRPVAPRREEREGMSDDLEALLAGLANAPSLAIGDFNTGAELDSTHEYFKGDRYRSWLSSGWTDAYRQCHGDRREYSWWNASSGNGFRLDHAFVSKPARDRVLAVQYVHEVDGIALHRHPDTLNGQPVASDHAALVVELADGPGGER